MKSFQAFFIILIFAIASAAQTNPATIVKNTAPDNQNSANEERYRIGFQDTLEIQVFRHPELNQRVSVNPDGTIFLFRADRPITAVCKTERELAGIIEKEYISFLKKPEINVVAVEQKSQSFGVIGAVEKPGSFYINRRIQLLELISFAGGPSKEAGSRMIVARTGSKSACQSNQKQVSEDDLILMNFKIKDVLEAKQNLCMQPGDIVSVLDSDVIYVYGNVNKEGPVKTKEPITLTQAIVSAEGFKPSTKKDKIRILRQKDGTQEREELIFDLKEIDQRKVKDPFLQPNDIVAVSEDPTKSIMRKIGNSLTNGIPSILYKIP